MINNDNRRVEFNIEIIEDKILEPFEFLTAEFVITSASGAAYTDKTRQLVYIEDNDCEYILFLFLNYNKNKNTFNIIYILRF